MLNTIIKIISLSLMVLITTENLSLAASVDAQHCMELLRSTNAELEDSRDKDQVIYTITIKNLDLNSLSFETVYSSESERNFNSPMSTKAITASCDQNGQLTFDEDEVRVGGGAWIRSPFIHPNYQIQTSIAEVAEIFNSRVTNSNGPVVIRLGFRSTDAKVPTWTIEYSAKVLAGLFTLKRIAFLHDGDSSIHRISGRN